MSHDTIHPSDASTYKLIVKIAEEACVGLFDAYGLSIQPCAGSESEVATVSLTGIVGFTGPGISGMCLLASDREPLRASNPTDGALSDWVAELVNQLAGRIKRQLVTRGALVYITTPIVVRGAKLEPLPGKDLRPIVFQACGGRITLWIEVATAPDFVLAPEGGEETLEEGEALLF